MESAKIPLETTLAAVAAYIQRHFPELQERCEEQKIQAAEARAEWAIREEQLKRKEVIRLAKEMERKRAEEIAAAVEAKKRGVLNAAENFRRSNLLLEFIDVCERRWRSGSIEPTSAQTAWLSWAREIATAISPLSTGYPDPAAGGALDTAPLPPKEPSEPTCSG